MNLDLWILNPWGELCAIPWELAAEMGIIGLQRISHGDWLDLIKLLPCPI
jgi:hypothetical protein